MNIITIFMFHFFFFLQSNMQYRESYFENIALQATSDPTKKLKYNKAALRRNLV